MAVGKIPSGSIDWMPEVDTSKKQTVERTKEVKKVDWSGMNGTISFHKYGIAVLDDRVTVSENGTIFIRTAASLSTMITGNHEICIWIRGVFSSRVVIESPDDGGWDWWESFQPRDGGSRWDKKHPENCRVCAMVRRNIHEQRDDKSS